jgi:DNA invertase Pin-like site-specific DNA recombinase
MRVIGYVRVSTNEQASNGHGLDAQRAAIAAEAERRGWTVQWLEDPGASAKSLDRPGMRYGLDLLRRGDAEALVVSKMDRLSRSLSDFVRLMETAKKEKWALVTLDPDVDMTTPNGKLLANLMAVFAEWEREMIGQRTKDGLAAARAKGIRLGRPPEVDVDVAQRISSLRSGGATLTTIAELLTAEQVPTARGGERWWPSTVRGVLGRAAVAA